MSRGFEHNAPLIFLASIRLPKVSPEASPPVVFKCARVSQFEALGTVLGRMTRRAVSLEAHRLLNFLT